MLSALEYVIAALFFLFVASVFVFSGDTADTPDLEGVRSL
jgi:hypothetical protein